MTIKRPGDLLDKNEWDLDLRTYNWKVDLCAEAGDLENLATALWRRVNHTQGGNYIENLKTTAYSRCEKCAEGHKTLRLERSFSMCGLKFWRVHCPGHQNQHSDLSLDGLRHWGVIPMPKIVTSNLQDRNIVVTSV